MTTKRTQQTLDQFRDEVLRLESIKSELLEILVLARGQVSRLGGTPDPDDPHADFLQRHVLDLIESAITKARGQP